MIHGHFDSRLCVSGLYGSGRHAGPSSHNVICFDKDVSMIGTLLAVILLGIFFAIQLYTSVRDQK